MKESKYNVLIGNILINTKTQAKLQFDNLHKKLYVEKKFNEFSCDELQLLNENGFLVDNNFNETKDILNQLKKKETKELHLIIFPTMQCNFRCLYCYEDKYESKLDNKCYQNLLESIYKTNVEKISISWFGGEPSLKQNEIISFMQKLKLFTDSKGIKLKCSMTTNFYLVDKNLFNKFVNAGITFFQVTLDGDREIHNFYRPLNNGCGSFDKILENLYSAKETNLLFKIQIRTNFDKNSDYTKYVHLLENFKNDIRFSFELHPICNWDNISREYVCEKEDVLIREKELTKLFERNGLKISLSNKLSRLSMCYACCKNSFVIDQNFNVKKCTVHLNDKTNDLGIFIDFNKIKDDMWTEFHFSNCPDCACFPICLGKMCKYKHYETFQECQNSRKAELEVILNGK